MKLTFLGAAHEVTGSCALLTVNEKHILIDCGMEQGPDLYENQPLPIAAGDVDALLLTHAHIDHSGKIPLLCKEGFRGPIYCTSATANLCDIMLRDSAHIQEFEAEWRNRKALRAGLPEYVPLYTVQDAVNAMKQFSPCEYGEIIPICDGVSVRFSDVGHLLGSATIEIWVQEEEETKTIVFSGDIGTAGAGMCRNLLAPGGCCQSQAVLSGGRRTGAGLFLPPEVPLSGLFGCRSADKGAYSGGQCGRGASGPAQQAPV